MALNGLLTFPSVIGAPSASSIPQSAISEDDVMDTPVAEDRKGKKSKKKTPPTCGVQLEVSNFQSQFLRLSF